MKGLYVIWGDTDYIDKFIDAGIDNLMIAFYNLPSGEPNMTYMDSYERNVEIATRYKGKVRISMIPLWMRSWAPVPDDQQMIVGGIKRKLTPCPTNKKFIDSRLDSCLDLFNKGLVQDVYWDLEPYGLSEDYLDIFRGEIKCGCATCASLSFNDQWKIHTDYLKSKFSPIINNGQLCSEEWYTFSRYPNNVFYLDGQTYDKIPEWRNTILRELHVLLRKIRMRIGWLPTYRFPGINLKTAAGCFVEIFNSMDNYINYLKYTQKKLGVYDGYWIYTQKMFSKYSKIPETEIEQIRSNYGYYETRMIDEVDPNFFSKLKGM